MNDLLPSQQKRYSSPNNLTNIYVMKKENEVSVLITLSNKEGFVIIKECRKIKGEKEEMTMDEEVLLTRLKCI